VPCWPHRGFRQIGQGAQAFVLGFEQDVGNAVMDAPGAAGAWIGEGFAFRAAQQQAALAAPA
jgi:hypothetical protein